MTYSYVKVSGHHYEGLPTFWEVLKSDQLRSAGWFWKEADAKEFCDVMNACAAEQSLNATGQSV